MTALNVMFTRIVCPVRFASIRNSSREQNDRVFSAIISAVPSFPPENTLGPTIETTLFAATLYPRDVFLLVPGERTQCVPRIPRTARTPLSGGMSAGCNTIVE